MDAKKFISAATKKIDSRPYSSVVQYCEDAAGRYMLFTDGFMVACLTVNRTPSEKNVCVNIPLSRAGSLDVEVPNIASALSCHPANAFSDENGVSDVARKIVEHLRQRRPDKKNGLYVDPLTGEVVPKNTPKSLNLELIRDFVTSGESIIGLRELSEGLYQLSFCCPEDRSYLNIFAMLISGG